MARMAAEAGTTDLVATPHCNSRFRFQPALIQERLEELRNAVGPVPAIHSGCELHLTPESVQDALEYPNKYTIDNRQYLLVELADSFLPKTITVILGNLLGGGMVPVIVHPERNPVLQPMADTLSEWCEMGCLIQVTAQSVSGDFGEKARHSSHRLLGLGKVHVVASDAHDIQRRPPLLGSARREVAAKYGESMAEALFTINPRTIVDGGTISTSDSRQWRKSRSAWQRFRMALVGSRDLAVPSEA